MGKIVMPKLGLTMKEGKITKWVKKNGDMVYEGETLLHIETEKLSNEVVSVETGILHILKEEGLTVAVAEEIAEILSENDALEVNTGTESLQDAASGEGVGPATPRENDNSSPAVAGTGKNQIRATPASKKLAKEKSVDLALVTATRSDGTIDKRAVQNYLALEKDHQVAATPLAKREAEKSGIDLDAVAGTGARGKIIEEDVLKAKQAGQKDVESDSVDELGRSYRRRPLSSLQKVMARHMSECAATVAPVTLTAEVDMTESTRMKKSLPFKTSFTAIMATVVSRALVKHPGINATLAGDELIEYSTVNLGIAVDTEQGLLVPAIFSAEQKSLVQITDDLGGIASRAREGKLNMDELTCGTFTLTNLGMFGIDRFTPIVNIPEVAILGVGNIFDKYVDIEGAMVKRPCCSFSLTFDHRAIDGAGGARFLATVKEYMENPYSWLAG
ncbi:dihydrolipoamide acetyltransferase family protein [Desulforhopalus singaporensis]|uniref:Dihydrolipoamide acetyltransferase component of pyruvate dehydrogenase complex n=1 Tax=Desulforhopalus singaporensis TaxID=91360 RepID=A0A1H0T0S1_9BACT|nr:dihydrolipoamide acetyltransferase family protein [Desulforhopalus singaporensis]SDP47682.1 pyruvate dehydrogenase E2 component (dihydrolipoamide acetyltransferase) [Desulforhopalus singaporensis]